MMQAKKAVVIGATGLIGSQLINLLVEDGVFDEIILLVRKPFVTSLRKVRVIQVNFSDTNDIEKCMVPADVLFCCIGTTQKKVNGDKIAYRKVDYDITVNVAKIARQKGCSNCMLVSSVGADVSSSNFYLQLKGQVEEAISALGMTTVGIFRPSILLGNRKEFRLGELFGKAIFRFISPFFVGPLRKYKPISGKDVAKAMVAAAKQARSGILIYTYDEMKNLAE